jgi:hypothetical protein
MTVKSSEGVVVRLVLGEDKIGLTGFLPQKVNHLVTN